MPTADEQRQAAESGLRQDLGSEYQTIIKVVSDFDGRLMIVKGWSVTLSLAGLGLAFQQGHYALFALAAISAVSFWFVDASMKRHQLRYYARMRDIEVAAYHLNRLDLGGQIVSSPLVDWSWGRSGAPSAEPSRRDPQNVTALLRRAWWMPHVLLPHAVPALVGVALFLGALAGAPGLERLEP